MKKDHKENDYVDHEPQVYVGFSELDDKDYETEKMVHCPGEAKLKKKRNIMNARAKANTKASTELLGNKRSKDEAKNVKEIKKKKMMKETHQQSVSPLSKEQYSQEVIDINLMEVESKEDEKEIQSQLQSQSQSELVNITDCSNAPSIALESFPLIKANCYFIKNIALTSITHSYHSIKDKIMNKSIQIQKALIDKENRNVIQMNINHFLMNDLKKDIERVLSSTKLWYNSSIQNNMKENHNLLSYCRYDIVGVTIGKAVLIPQETRYHLNNYELINFRTVIINLGPGDINHSIIPYEYSTGFVNYFKQNGYSHYERISRSDLLKGFIEENEITLQTVVQSPYTILVLEPGIIHWCNTSMAPSLFVYWSLLQQNNAEYTKTRTISEKLSSLNKNPLIPLLALQLDILNHSLDHQPLDSIKDSYLDIQNLFRENSLMQYEQMLIEQKVGLIPESSNTKICFCDFCHREIFNYYTVNTRMNKAFCLKCMCADTKSRPIANKIIVYKYTQKDLDKVLNRMQDKIKNSYNNNANTNNNTNLNAKASIRNSQLGPSKLFLGYTKKIFKKKLEQSIENEDLNNYLYSYETYSPYDDVVSKNINYDMISNYLIELIDRDKAKTDFVNPLLFSNKKYPYSDCEYLKDYATFNWASYNNGVITDKKKEFEGRSQLTSMLEFHTKNNGDANSNGGKSFSLNDVSYTQNKSKLHDHLIGNSIFDFAKKVVNERKEMNKPNASTIHANSKHNSNSNSNSDQKRFQFS